MAHHSRQCGLPLKVKRTVDLLVSFALLVGFTGAILNRDADPPHFDRYYNERARRHNVLLGITGWSQINGRNAITWNQKFESDVWYVDHRSLWLDIKILWLTAMTIIHREGISQTGQVTQELLNA